MTLADFKKDIHALILSRGEEYFGKGFVKELLDQGSGWTAIVGDQSTYKVVLNGHKKFESWHCECPFDHGPVCKHVAATMIAVKSHFEYIEDEIKLAGGYLGKLNLEELKLFVEGYLEQDKTFRKHFLSTYYE